MSTIEILQKDITRLDVDAVVNAANAHLQVGSGVCGAIFKAAGVQDLQESCDRIGHCDVGSAVITPGFALVPWIIHAVGPKWVDGEHGERELLAGAYRTALELAAEEELSSICFPLISAGKYGYPVELAWKDALSACKSWLDEHPRNDLRIVFAIRDDEILHAGQEALKTLAPEYEAPSDGKSAAVKLTEVTEENWMEVAELTVKESQKRFLAPPIGILARGYVYRGCNGRVRVIESDGTVVGVALVREFTDEPLGYDLQQFMIDARFQGRGLGSAALALILDELRREGHYDRVEVCVKGDNVAALDLFEKHGFVGSGYVDPDVPDAVNLICRLS